MGKNGCWREAFPAKVGGATTRAKGSPLRFGL